MSEPLVGIDLGTTFSCVGVVQDGKVHILENDGVRTTPSVVAFVESEEPDENFRVVIGKHAKLDSPRYPLNTIFCAKRLIGRSFGDPVVEGDLRVWPFKVINSCDKPKYELQIDGHVHTFFPEEISAQVLIRLKQVASDFLQEDVKKAVITVPAYFNENQKLATRHAARLAGLEVLDLLSEPNAAAIAYGVDLQEGAARTALVFDFGGGTFDVSILKIQDGEFTVLAIDGDGHLGGEDIDNKLAEYFEDIFNRKNNTKLRVDDARAWRRLKHKCESLKIQLSKSLIANITLPLLHEGKDLNGSLTRAKFEELNSQFFSKCLEITDRVIYSSTVKKEQINDILLVGGSTRIPKVLKDLQSFFNLPNPPKEKVNVDEAVAHGATILAAIKSGVVLDRVPKVKLWVALPQSLGIGTPRGLMHTFVKRNTRVPVTETMIFSTDKDNQTILRFKIFEGESTDTSKNYFLGEFRIAGIPPAPRGIPKIEVTFTLNEDCLLQVTAKDLATWRQKGIKVEYDTERLTEEELRELQNRAQNIAEYDTEVRARVEALNKLEEYAKEIRLASLNERLREQVPEDVSDFINEIYQWVDNWHDQKSYPTVEKAQSMKKKLQDMWDPFITKVYAAKQKADAPIVL